MRAWHTSAKPPTATWATRQSTRHSRAKKLFFVQIWENGRPDVSDVRVTRRGAYQSSSSTRMCSDQHDAVTVFTSSTLHLRLAPCCRARRIRLRCNARAGSVDRLSTWDPGTSSAGPGRTRKVVAHHGVESLVVTVYSPNTRARRRPTSCLFASCPARPPSSPAASPTRPPTLASPAPPSRRWERAGSGTIRCRAPRAARPAPPLASRR